MRSATANDGKVEVIDHDNEVTIRIQKDDAKGFRVLECKVNRDTLRWLMFGEEGQ